MEQEPRTSEDKEATFTHRFELHSENAPEGLARERLRVFRDALSEVQERYPEVLGATIFGSTVKGRVKSESDIDSYLFIDADKAVEAKRPFNTVNVYDRHTSTPTDPRLADLRMKLTMELDLTVKQVMHIFEIPISAEIIHEMVSSEATNVANRIKLEEENPHLHPQPLSSVTDMHTIRALFHLGVNDAGIRPYRAQAIEEMKKLGTVGERLWQDITRHVLYYEEGRRGAEIYFPKTLDEAARIYN